jgi:CRISPR-associated endonuclease Cas3-HD
MTYFAHSSDKKEWQLLRDHLKNVAELGEKFGKSFGEGDLAFLAGVLHDIGKYSSEFQSRLKGSKEMVDHSSAGTQEVVKLYNNPGMFPWGTILAYVISGHHGGLNDYGSRVDIDNSGTLYAKLKKRIPEYKDYYKEIGSLLPENKLSFDFKKNSFGLPFLSCVADLFNFLIFL